MWYSNIFPLFTEESCTCVQVHEYEIIIHTKSGKMYIIIVMSQFTVFLHTQLYFTMNVSPAKLPSIMTI